MLRLAIPAALLLFFVWRSFSARIFLLGIPFMMYMAHAVFFDKLKIFWIPGRLEPADHLMLWLVLVWVVYFDLLLPGRRIGRPFGPRLLAPEEVLLAVFAGFCGLEVVLTVIRFGEIASALGQAKGFVYLFVGYVLLRAMLAHAGRKQTVDFLVALVGVNTLAAFLFVVHQGLHLPIYDDTEYQTVTFMGQELTRSFYFMPAFLGLATALSIAQRRWTVYWVGVFVVTLAALWISYTRSLIVIAVVEVVVVLGARLLKSREAALAVRRGLAIAGIVVVFVLIAFVALPVQSQYLLSRIGMATAAGGVTQDQNVQNRQHKIDTIWEWIQPESVALGQGFASPSQNATVSNLDWMSADLIWVPVLYRLGVIGTAILVAVFAAYGWRALTLTVSGDGDAELLALVFLATLIGLFLEGFVSWTLLNPERYPMGLWLFAFAAAEAWRRRQEAAEPALAPADAPSAAAKTSVAAAVGGSVAEDGV